ncbi:DNA relaxase mbeA [Neisseria gonorrhoeae]|uniref:DNA relaxase mbeA n=1 Tax=Neisseria gonorrhoeae TaxID=485 RepID=A0A379B1D0_NEIGO|nr:DNA relaxase mbeA [Neisseria gonorrhoeae]
MSGKRLQPYYYAADRGRVDAWRTMQNLTHGYSDPDDPAKRQSMTQAKDLPRNTQEAAQSITEHHRRLRSPSPIRQAKSRADVLETLEKVGLKYHERPSAASASRTRTQKGATSD